MELSLKKRLLAYIKESSKPATDEAQTEREELIKKLETEAGYVDINTHTLSVDDLEYNDSETLRRKLGKKDGEAYTIEDCEKVSEALADLICDNFGEDLNIAIDYRL